MTNLMWWWRFLAGWRQLAYTCSMCGASVFAEYRSPLTTGKWESIHFRKCVSRMIQRQLEESSG